MAELLFEILSEEIPARMQAGAARDLERLVVKALEDQRLTPQSVEVFSGPRRLVLRAAGLPERQADRVESRKGPRVEAPAAALEGFLRSTGLSREALAVRDGIYFAEISKPGRPSLEVLSELLAAVVEEFPWPKAMRWGRGALRWVRPIRRILALLDDVVVPVRIGDLTAGNLTEGHRFMGPKGPVEVRGFAEYSAALEARFVVLEREKRKLRISEEARAVCAREDLELVEDEGLLEEVAGLVEWPVVVLGRMDPEFLALPREVVQTSMRVHQKYFAVRDPIRGGLAPRFVVVANIEASDGGVKIAEGNGKVLAARLRDAEFFWREDQKNSLTSRLERLKGVVFHAKIGTMFERAERLEALTTALAPSFGAPPGLAALAGRLAKTDLVTGMVGEFPELQGVMGGYYAELEGARALAGAPRPPEWDAVGDDAELKALAAALRDQYRPQGPSDALPEGALGRALALADKLDTLVSFFSVGERPTGSRDPFALRRAALGAIRILLAAGPGLRLAELLGLAAETGPPERRASRRIAVTEVRAFIFERLRVLLREEGRRHDLLDAVFATGGDDLALLLLRAKALEDFLNGAAGEALLAGYRRAGNILKAEAKKEPPPDPAGAHAGEEPHAGDTPEAERILEAGLSGVEGAVAERLGAQDFLGAMEAFSRLREPVDAFFDTVLVNAPDPRVRARRLGLLGRVRTCADRIADFSQISG